MVSLHHDQQRVYCIILSVTLLIRKTDQEREEITWPLRKY